MPLCSSLSEHHNADGIDIDVAEKYCRATEEDEDSEDEDSDGPRVVADWSSSGKSLVCFRMFLHVYTCHDTSGLVKTIDVSTLFLLSECIY